MKKGWQAKPFEDCIESVKYTRKIQRKDFLDDGQFPIVSQEAEFTNGYWDDEADVFKVLTPVVIFGDHTQVLKYVDFDFVLGADGVKILPPRDFLRPKFFFYQLQAVNFTSLGYARHYRLLKGLEIKYPPLPEQQRIVTILDEAFEGIATARANAEQNLKNARELFESHLQAVFSQRGEGWVETKFGDVCGFVRGPFGGSLKKNIFVSDGYAVYEQQHAIYDQFDDVRYFIKESKFKEMKRFELLPGDLIMSCSGTMGKVAIVPDGIRQGIINQALLKLTPSKKIEGNFLKLWMESEAFQYALKEFSGGAAIQNVASVKILKEINVPLPAVKDQKKIVSEIELFREETQRFEAIYQKKITALDELKKALLHKAFSGEL